MTMPPLDATNEEILQWQLTNHGDVPYACCGCGHIVTRAKLIGPKLISCSPHVLQATCPHCYETSKDWEMRYVATTTTVGRPAVKSDARDDLQGMQSKGMQSISRGQIFRNYRIMADVGVRQLADMAGVLPSRLLDVENGRDWFTEEELEKINAALAQAFKQKDSGSIGLTSDGRRLNDQADALAYAAMGLAAAQPHIRTAEDYEPIPRHGIIPAGTAVYSSRDYDQATNNWLLKLVNKTKEADGEEAMAELRHHFKEYGQCRAREGYVKYQGLSPEDAAMARLYYTRKEGERIKCNHDVGYLLSIDGVPLFDSDFQAPVAINVREQWWQRLINCRLRAEEGWPMFGDEPGEEDKKIALELRASKAQSKRTSDDMDFLHWADNGVKYEVVGNNAVNLPRFSDIASEGQKLSKVFDDCPFDTELINQVLDEMTADGKMSYSSVQGTPKDEPNPRSRFHGGEPVDTSSYTTTTECGKADAIVLEFYKDGQKLAKVAGCDGKEIAEQVEGIIKADRVILVAGGSGLDLWELSDCLASVCMVTAEPGWEEEYANIRRRIQACDKLKVNVEPSGCEVVFGFDQPGDVSPFARYIAAQCWTDEETKHIEMDGDLAEAMARRIQSIYATYIDDMESAWGLIANAWEFVEFGANEQGMTLSKQWIKAAERWRDERWHTLLYGARVAKGEIPQAPYEAAEDEFYATSLGASYMPGKPTERDIAKWEALFDKFDLELALARHIIQEQYRVSCERVQGRRRTTGPTPITLGLCTSGMKTKHVTGYNAHHIAQKIRGIDLDRVYIDFQGGEKELLELMGILPTLVEGFCRVRGQASDKIVIDNVEATLHQRMIQDLMAEELELEERLAEELELEERYFKEFEDTNHCTCDSTFAGRPALEHANNCPVKLSFFGGDPAWGVGRNGERRTTRDGKQFVWTAPGTWAHLELQAQRTERSES